MQSLGGDMKAEDFVKGLPPRAKWTRTNLVTGEVESAEGDVDSTATTVLIAGSKSGILCYTNRDLFTVQGNVHLAVVRTGSGNLFCDRYEETRTEAGLRTANR